MFSKVSQIFTALGFGVFLFCVGCEVDSPDSHVRINPDSGVLQKHHSITLNAHNGYRYRWSLSTEEWGTLNQRTGNQVVYTSLYEPVGDTPAVQIIRVVSYFSDTSASGTNVASTSLVSNAEAYISHLPSRQSAGLGE